MRFLFFFVLLSAVSVSRASIVDEALSKAIRNNEVGRVRMLLQNNPNLNRLNPGNDWSYLWQVLFTSDGYKSAAPPPLSASQREMAELLLKADPTLILRRTGKDATAPLTALFEIYDQTCEDYGCEHAKGIEDRIRFVMEHGARIESEWHETPTVRLPLSYYVAGLRPETFELALSLGVPVNEEFSINTGVTNGPLRLLSYLTALAIGENDPARAESALKKIEMLLSRGADPRKTHRAPNGARLPIFVSVFLSWDSMLQKRSVESLDTSRYPKILRLFFEYGLSEYEDWGDSYISEWPSHESAWRRASLRMLMQLVTSGEKPPPKASDCERKLDEQASQASLK